MRGTVVHSVGTRPHKTAGSADSEVSQFWIMKRKQIALILEDTAPIKRQPPNGNGTTLTVRNVYCEEVSALDAN